MLSVPAGFSSCFAMQTFFGSAKKRSALSPEVAKDAHFAVTLKLV
jgi:hypothetical protein